MSSSRYIDYNKYCHPNESKCNCGKSTLLKLQIYIVMIRRGAGILNLRGLHMHLSTSKQILVVRGDLS